MSSLLHLHTKNAVILNPRLIISRLVSSELVRNSSKLLGANVFAQAIALLVYPILTRIYSPADFGIFNLFLSIGGVLCIFSTAEYQYAILLPKAESKAISTFHVGLKTSVLVALLCLISVCFSRSIADLFHAPALSVWYWLIPAYVFLSALWTLLNYWYTRHKQFGNISGYQMSQNIFSSVMKIALGYLGCFSGGMIVSSVVALFLSLSLSIKMAYRKTIKPLLQIDNASCRECAYEYRNFPKYSLPRAVVNYLSGNLPTLLLSPFFALSEIGFWGMAFTLAFRPTNMVTNSLYQVFFQRTAERVQNHLPIKSFFVKFVRNTALLVLPVFVVLYFILPWLSTWLLGAEWREAGSFIRMMLPWLFMSSLVAPICYLLDVFQQQKLALFFEILMIVVRAAALACGIVYDNFQMAILLYCIGSALVILVQLLWYMSLINKYERTLTDDERIA